MQEISSPGLDDSEADNEVQAKDEAAASEDLSPSEGANSSPPPTATPNSPPSLVSTEEDTKEDEAEEEGKPEERQEEAEEETNTEEWQEETEEETKTEEMEEEPEEETKTEERKEKAEEVGKKENEWLDVLGSGQLLKKVREGSLFVPVTWVHTSPCNVQTLRAGEGVSSRPTPQCQVRMRVRGTLPSGTSIDRFNSLSFIVGDGDVIQGMKIVARTCTHCVVTILLLFPYLYWYPAIDITASLMEKGEVCSVKADPRFAYGAAGR